MKAVGRECEQLRRRGQVGLGAEEIDVAHIGREPRQPSVKVDTLAVPAGEAMNRERVSQIVRPGPDAAGRWFETGHAEHSAQRVVRGLHRQRPTIAREEERCVMAGLRSRKLAPSEQVSLELAPQRRMKRNPPSAAFEFLDEDGGPAEVHIDNPQAQRFAEAQPGAVENEEQRAIERAAKSGTLQIGCESQQGPDVDRGENLRNERRLRRELGPTDLTTTLRGVVSSDIEPELPNDRHLLRHADRETRGTARQPRQDDLIEPPRSVMLRTGRDEPVEVAQRELGPVVAITPTTLELQKGHQRRRERARERPFHRGTGSASVRNRRSATRTYAEVDAGRLWPRMSLTIFGRAPRSICRVA